jgi:hypothetical protein
MQRRILLKRFLKAGPKFSQPACFLVKKKIHISLTNCRGTIKPVEKRAKQALKTHGNLRLCFRMMP